MDFWIPAAATAVSAYLLGSVNAAILVARATKRADIRSQGSGNAGTTNMLRTYGKAAAAATALGDLAKAVAAVLIARALFAWLGPTPLGFDPGWLAGLFVILGHIRPVYFRFKGGKGVMPAVGVVLLVDPFAAFVLLVLAVVAFLVSRTMSVVSLCAAVELPLVTMALAFARRVDPLAGTLFALAYGILVAVSHRENLKRLWNGTEKPLLPR